jgi:hypothetical protein
MVNDTVISQEVIKFLQHGKQKIDPSIIVYRDSPTIDCEHDNVESSAFVISIKVKRLPLDFTESYDKLYVV